jgi:hypothetical protein
MYVHVRVHVVSSFLLELLWLTCCAFFLTFLLLVDDFVRLLAFLVITPVVVAIVDLVAFSAKDTKRQNSASADRTQCFGELQSEKDDAPAEKRIHIQRAKHEAGCVLHVRVQHDDHLRRISVGGFKHNGTQTHTHTHIHTHTEHKHTMRETR